MKRKRIYQFATYNSVCWAIRRIGGGLIRKVFTAQGTFYELPGGRLCDPEITDELIRRGDLRAADDGLFGPSSAQTFKLVEY
jgi:hypothetical protein